MIQERSSDSHLVPAHLHGTAYGIYNATLGLLDFPASVIAGVLWRGAFGWAGFGASAPFFFGAGAALLAAVFMIAWKPAGRQGQGVEG
jgi:predicted phage tail protein